MRAEMPFSMTPSILAVWDRLRILQSLFVPASDTARCDSISGLTGSCIRILNIRIPRFRIVDDILENAIPFSLITYNMIVEATLP